MDSRNTQWDLVTYFTPDYLCHFNKLKASCDKLNIKLTGYNREEQPSWVECCAVKPLVIKQALEETDRPYVVWTDADSTIERYPELFDSFNGVFGVHYRAQLWRHLCSGTMIISKYYAMHIIDEWIAAQDRQPKEWDQRTLELILKDDEVTELPASYCCIYDAPDMLEACDNKPVILHHQASRAKKNAENNKRAGII